MIPYSGDWKEDATIHVMFNTFTSNDPSASCTITNFANTDVHIHKDDGLTQRNNAAGITVSIDFDGITGSHMIKIDTNDDTVAGFWVTGKDYFVRIEGTTIDGATINSVVGQFSIENRFNEVDVTKWLGQACAAVTINGVPEVDITHLLGTAWLSPAVAGTPDVNAKKLGGTAQTGRDVGTSVLLSAGSGAGQLDFTSGVVKSNLAQILGTALTETAGWLAAGFKKLFNVATPLLVASDVMRGTDSANTTTPPTVSAIVNEWETQSQANPTGFHVNVLEVNGTAQTANDNGADINSILTDTGTTLETHLTDIKGGTFAGATDSLEAIRDRGDSAWTTGGGGSISDILNVQVLIPGSLDLANTATVRIGLGLTNMLDNLPSTAEITPGTITIDRKAIGGTSWSNIVNAAACSEVVGLIYYDEVFDSGTGYVAGDSIRITFKSQKITVAANDYEIIGTDGWIFQTHIREAMRGTNSAALATGVELSAQGKLDVNAECDTAFTDYDSPTKTEMDNAFTEIKGATWAVGTDTLEHIRNKETDIETDTQAIETDTQDIQSRIPAALSSGNIKADVLAISTSTDAADKLEASAETIVTGAAQTGTLSTTEMTTDLTISVNDQMNGRVLIFKEDTTTVALRRQATDITDSVTTNGKLTFTALTTAPVNGDTFCIV